MKMRFEQPASIIPEPIHEDIESLRGELAVKYERYRDEEAIEKMRDELLKKYPEMSKEMLNLFMDISWEINALHQDGALSQDEAETMVALLMKSKGRDNLTTMALLMTCGAKLQSWKLDRE